MKITGYEGDEGDEGTVGNEAEKGNEGDESNKEDEVDDDYIYITTTWGEREEAGAPEVWHGLRMSPPRRLPALRKPKSLH